MNTLKRVSLKGFKSIKSLESLEFGPVNVLIGPNSSGKSNLIGFFQMLNYAVSEGLQVYIQQRGFGDSFLHFGSKTTPMMHGEVEIQAQKGLDRYRFSLAHAVPDTLIFTREEVYFWRKGSAKPLEKHLDPGGKESALPAMAASRKGDALHNTVRVIKTQLERKRVYQFHDTSLSSHIRKASLLHDSRYLRSDGGNLSAVLYRLMDQKPEYYRRIVLYLRRVIPGFQEFVLEPEGDSILLSWRGKDPEYRFGPHQVSDGSLRMMALTTLLLQPPEDLPEMIIIDEPELGLHPTAEALLAGLVRSASASLQILVATQSASFVDEFEPEDIIVAEQKEGESVFRRLAESELQEWLKDYSLGEVWRKNLIGGRP